MKHPILCLALVFSTIFGLSAEEREDAALPTLPKLNLNDPLPAGLFVNLNKMVNPAVVNIFTSFAPRERLPRDPFFELFGGPPGGDMAPQQSLGSGFIIREDGLILTNNHVIDKADLIKVQIEERGKESFVARVIGRDARTDIALIKIDARKKLPFLRLGSSTDTQVGEWVAAFGNPYGYGHSMTKGIISALGRELEELNTNPFMQTDASINPGNSGGPLVNTQGLVIGVNTAVDARAQGIGFVIPIDAVKSMLADLEKDGVVKRAFIGVHMQDIDPDLALGLHLKNADGALITEVEPGTPADRAGLQSEDFVTEFNGVTIESTKDLSKAVANTPINQTVVIKFIRKGVPTSVKITVGVNSEPKVSSRARGRAGPSEDPRESIAPFNLGFSVVDYSPRLPKGLNVPAQRKPHPVIIGVLRDSESARVGLSPGNVILEVNRREVTHAWEVISALKRSTIKLFILKVQKSDERSVLVSLRAS